MNRKEKAYIKKKAELYLEWSKAEKEIAQQETEQEEKESHYHQADVNYTLYITYDNLIAELEELTNCTN